MSLPRSTRYLVIGAGIHGLSTAYHLAKELRTRGTRLGQRHPRRRQDRTRRRRVGHRLRRRPQQLLPARDVRADAGLRRGLGVRSGGLRLQPGRLHRARPGAPGVGPHGGLRAPPAHRLRLRADPRRGRGRRAHEGALPRLAREERDRLPAREAGRLRVQPRLGRRASSASASPRASRSSRASRSPASSRRAAATSRAVETERGHDRGRARRRRARARGPSTSGACSTCR